MNRFAGGVFIAGTLLLFSACTVGRMTHDMDTRIQTHYEQEAKAMQDKAVEHRNMAQAYAKSGGYAVTKGNALQHCNALASTYQQAAGENLELAKQHRQLAEQAPK